MYKSLEYYGFVTNISKLNIYTHILQFFVAYRQLLYLIQIGNRIIFTSFLLLCNSLNWILLLVTIKYISGLLVFWCLYLSENIYVSVIICIELLCSLNVNIFYDFVSTSFVSTNYPAVSFL